MGPIDYSSLLAQLDLRPLSQSLGNIRQANVQQQEANARTTQADAVRMKVESEVQGQQAFQTDVGALLKNPTADGYQQLFAKYPEQYQGLKQSYDSYSNGQKNRNRNDAMEVLGLINAGATDAAVSKLTARRADLTKTNESTEITDALIADLKSGEPTRIARAKGTAAFALYPALGDDAKDILTTLGLAPGGVTEREKFDETQRHNRASEGVAQGGLAVRQSNSARAAAKAKSGGKGSTKKGAYSDAQLDALLN